MELLMVLKMGNPKVAKKESLTAYLTDEKMGKKMGTPTDLTMVKKMAAMMVDLKGNLMGETTDAMRVVRKAPKTADSWVEMTVGMKEPMKDNRKA